MSPMVDSSRNYLHGRKTQHVHQMRLKARIVRLGSFAFFGSIDYAQVSVPLPILVSHTQAVLTQIQHFSH